MMPIPAELAVPVAVAGAGAIGVLWRRNVVLEDRAQANVEKQIESNNAVVRALDALGASILRSRS